MVRKLGWKLFMGKSDEKNPCWIVQWSLSMPIKWRQEILWTNWGAKVTDALGRGWPKEIPFWRTGLFPLLGELSEWNLGKQTFLSFYVKKLRLRVVELDSLLILKTSRIFQTPRAVLRIKKLPENVGTNSISLFYLPLRLSVLIKLLAWETDKLMEPDSAFTAPKAHPNADGCEERIWHNHRVLAQSLTSSQETSKTWYKSVFWAKSASSE